LYRFFIKEIVMAKPGEVYTCEKCGNVVVVVKEGGNPHIDCCGENMKKKEI
jgi:desulfoferrodoxin-like iron-binding protein